MVVVIVVMAKMATAAAVVAVKVVVVVCVVVCVVRVALTQKVLQRAVRLLLGLRNHVKYKRRLDRRRVFFELTHSLAIAAKRRPNVGHERLLVHCGVCAGAR